MNAIKEALGMGHKNAEHGSQHEHVDQSGGRGLLETSRYETTADKMGLIPSHKLEEARAHGTHGNDNLVDQSGGRGLLETSRYESTSDKMGLIPSQQLQEQRGQSVSSGTTSDYPQGTSSGTGLSSSTAAGGAYGSTGMTSSTADQYGSTGSSAQYGTTGGLASGMTDSYDTTTGSSGLTGMTSGSADQYGTTGSSGLTSGTSGYETTQGSAGQYNTTGTSGNFENVESYRQAGPLLQDESAESVAARVLGAPEIGGSTGSSTGMTGTGTSGRNETY